MLPARIITPMLEPKADIFMTVELRPSSSTVAPAAVAALVKCLLMKAARVSAKKEAQSPPTISQKAAVEDLFPRGFKAPQAAAMPHDAVMKPCISVL
mmetsp:Transcript_19551/g.31700  ORF Transcript_19551/g.31700 Transcript_19551/m.31700 type:complete len:97 (+) Transcript_19551:85-375(+)